MKKNKGSASAYRRQNGFTLIELLVVIAIIGILAAVVLAFLNTSRVKAEDARIKSQLKSMNSQALLFSGSSSPVLLSTPVLPGNIVTTTDQNLFTSTTASNSLYPLLSKLPADTNIYYGWDGVRPDNGGKWFVATGTKTGAIGVDYTGTVKSWKGTTPVSQADFIAIFPDANATSYSCQTVNNNPTSPPSDPQCSDGVDNDRDRDIDRDDPNCHSNGDIREEYVPNWDSESTPPSGLRRACSDGVDNDRDGDIDESDRNCHYNGDIRQEYVIDWDSESTSPRR